MAKTKSIFDIDKEAEARAIAEAEADIDAARVVPPYEEVVKWLGSWGFQLHSQSAQEGKEAKAKKASKTKFTCPKCAQNAWAKPDALLICGTCYDDGEGEIRVMLAEPDDEDEGA
jgi:hypothetical protein